MSKMARYVVFPEAIYMDESNSIHLITAKHTSLYELMHAGTKVNDS